ncbi:hypothetical protein L1049_011733 [Liquidambar formosana]|uniref:Uncharacterized protein n=1 Tax=Liquidambar formosana TaxID=63359 RepID=A0AAP0RX79_LIQFO
MTSFLLTFVDEILSEFGSLTASHSVPYIQFIFCFKWEKSKLENTLSRIRALIFDLQKKQERSHTEEDWLKRLEDILDDGRDLVDKLVQVQQEVNVNTSMAAQVFIFLSNLPFYSAMACRMKMISNRLNAAAADYTKFPPVQQADEGSTDKKKTKETHSFEPPTEIIGREGDKDEIKKLIKKCSDEKNVSIIPIVGIGGVGKTTIARLVYNDEEEDEKNHFDLKMWVWVGYVFDLKALIKKIIRAATKEECPELEMDLLQLRLREKLGGKKYLLVLDDVWNTNQQRWIELKNLLMGRAGSLILVTTRNKVVGQFMGNTGEPYTLKSLSKDNSWCLFEQLAFKPRQMEENPELVAVGEEILEKCRGIPLAIRTVARLLFEKNSYTEWLDVKNELWELAKEDTDILPTLRVSYAHLSSNLQKCFAHCTLFPKGSVIEKATLIQLWMAEDFIQHSKKRILEDIGEEYFKTLLNRNFFEDEEVNAYGNVLCCKMHDLMHDLAQTVAGPDYSTVNDDAVNNSESVIHVSVKSVYMVKIPTSLLNARKLRTFFMAGLLTKPDIDKLASAFKCLRALNLGTGQMLNSGSGHVLNSVGELKHLRYLDLSKTDISTLPNSVCELQNLQTLKLNYCKLLTELPRHIKNLVSLRHLENYGCNRLEGMPSGFGQLTSIQTLPIFVLGSGGLSELEGLNNLRGALAIKKLEKVRNPASKVCLKEKKYLQTLTLCWGTHEGNGDEDAALLEGLQPNRNLKGLNIFGYGNVRFPRWLLNMGNSLPYLVKMTLSDCPSCVHFPLFAQLRFLKVLKLSLLRSLADIRNYINESHSSFKDHFLSGAEEWFPSLKEVYLFKLPELTEWSREVVVDNERGRAKTEAVAEQRTQMLSLNCLSKLTIEHCPRLTTVPLHPDVKELTLHNVSEALIQSMRCAFSTLSKLKSLKICFCPDLVSLSEGWSANLTSIEHLSIWYCHELESLSRERYYLDGKELASSEEEDALSEEEGFQSLYSLKLFSLPKLTSLPMELQHATKLKELSINSCHSLVTLLESMENIRSLQSLAIHDCKKLISLPRGLQHLTALEKLEILDCPELNFSDEGNDMPGLGSLHSLKLSGLPKLVYLPKVLQHTPALQDLQISKCPGLITLPDWFGKLRSLRQLTISDCRKLKSLPEGMRSFTALRKLTITQCPYLLEKCQKETGKDWPKIAHIPEICILGEEPTIRDSRNPPRLPWK